MPHLNKLSSMDFCQFSSLKVEVIRILPINLTLKYVYILYHVIYFISFDVRSFNYLHKTSILPFYH